MILFTDTSLAATPNDLDFPHLTAYPTNLYHVSYSGEFAPPTFSGLIDESPWVFFDANFNTFILSAGTNYVIASNLKNGDGSISCGINSAITELPAGFTHRTILTIEPGINQAFDTWGNVLTGLSGKMRPANDAAVELDKLVQTLNDNPTVKIELSSHTDCRGKDAYNMTLSEKRAQSAVAYVVKQGIAKDRLVAKGYGETSPVEPCECGKCTEEENQANRRTEFKVLSK